MDLQAVILLYQISDFSSLPTSPQQHLQKILCSMTLTLGMVAIFYS